MYKKKKEIRTVDGAARSGKLIHLPRRDDRIWWFFIHSFPVSHFFSLEEGLN